MNCYPEIVLRRFASGELDEPGMSEVLWSCYTWPVSRGNSGKRTFFVNQTGDITGKFSTLVVDRFDPEKGEVFFAFLGRANLADQRVAGPQVELANL